MFNNPSPDLIIPQYQDVPWVLEVEKQKFVYTSRKDLEMVRKMRSWGGAEKTDSARMFRSSESELQAREYLCYLVSTTFVR